MPPAIPFREQVNHAVVAQLRTMSAGVQYHSTPSLVTLMPLAIDQYKGEGKELERGPVLGVTRSSSSLLTRIGLPNAFEEDYRFSVWGYVKGDVSLVSPTQDYAVEDVAILAGDRLERLWIDHVRCLLANRMLGGLLENPGLEPEPGAPLATDEGALEPYASFRQLWRAKSTPLAI